MSISFGHYLFVVRKEFSRALGLDKILVLGRLFFAVSLAVVGVQHLVGANFIMLADPQEHQACVTDFNT
jgi:hypothetical protein